MSLNIQLSASLITDLYKDLLVNPDASNKGYNPEPTKDASFKFLGSNLKKVSIIVSHPLEPFLTEPDLDFLIKILAACRLNLGDIAIINHHIHPVSITTLKEKLLPNKIVMFGIDPNAIGLPLNFPQFKLQEYDNCMYLHVPPFDELNQVTGSGRLLKSKLWICLKELFEV